MPIDRDRALALVIPDRTVTVERGALRAFAQATGDDRPASHEVAAARGDGAPDLRVPPTYFFSLELFAPDPFGFLSDLDIDLRHVLHGEQHFEYFTSCHAGDELTLRSRITDVTAKKGGPMELLTKETDVHRGDAPVARMRTVLVVRNPAGSAA